MVMNRMYKKVPHKIQDFMQNKNMCQKHTIMTITKNMNRATQQWKKQWHEHAMGVELDVRHQTLHIKSVLLYTDKSINLSQGRCV